MASNDPVKRKSMNDRPAGAHNRRGTEKDRQTPSQRRIRSGIGYLVMGLLGAWLLQQVVLSPSLSHAVEIPYSDFKSRLATGQIVNVTLGDTIEGVMKNPAQTPPTLPFVTVAPPLARRVGLQGLFRRAMECALQNLFPGRCELVTLKQQTVVDLLEQLMRFGYLVVGERRVRPLKPTRFQVMPDVTQSVHGTD